MNDIENFKVFRNKISVKKRTKRLQQTLILQYNLHIIATRRCRTIIFGNINSTIYIFISYYEKLAMSDSLCSTFETFI